MKILDLATSLSLGAALLAATCTGPAYCQRIPTPGVQDAANSASSASLIAVPPWQSAAGGKMAFEVASIRASKPGTFTPPNFALSNDDSYRPTGGMFKADFPVSTYIKFAYKLSPDEGRLMEASLPQWAKTEAFQIQAKADDQNSSKDQMRLMVQSLLVDRFKLILHSESQQVAVFFLIPLHPGKTGPTLRPHAEGRPCDVHVQSAPQGASEKAPDVFPPFCEIYGMRRTSGQTMIGSRNTTMNLLAGSLDNLGKLGRPVLDKTGISGRVDFTIAWTPESNGPASSDGNLSNDSQGPTFLEALKEQLGLTVEPAKAPLEVLVIDQVARPSDN